MPKDPPKLEHIAPPWFHKKWMELTDWVKGIQPVEGIGVQITDAPGGGMLISSRRSFSAVYVPAFEPKILRASGPSDDRTSIVVKLGPGSILLSERWNHVATIDGFDDEYTLTALGQGIWIRMEIPADGDKDLIDFTVGSGDMWAEYPDCFVHTGEEGAEDDSDAEEDHTQVWFQLIARLEPSSAETSHIKLNGDGCTLSHKTQNNLILRSDICAEQDGTKKNTMQLWPWFAAASV